MVFLSVSRMIRICFSSKYKINENHGNSQVFIYFSIYYCINLSIVLYVLLENYSFRSVMTNNALYLQETQRFAVKLHHFKAINIKLLCFEYELNVFASFSNGLIRILPKYADSFYKIIYLWQIQQRRGFVLSFLALQTKCRRHFVCRFFHLFQISAYIEV